MDNKILIRTPEELKKTIKETAASLGVSVNALILQILWEYVKKEKIDCFKNENGNK